MASKKIIDSNTEKILISSSKKVRAERIALDLTQEEFADFIDMKYATYKSFEQKGKISFDNYVKILIRLNKQEQFEKFLDGFEFNEQKARAINNKNNVDIKNKFIEPIINANQKQLTLDKKVFGTELFYSVRDGHFYEVPTFINIVLNSWNEKRLMLLIKYFGEDRLKPYMLKQKDTKLLKSFNKHIKHIKKRY
jgi:transcriptional regulator with XRE-family HTH domain